MQPGGSRQRIAHMLLTKRAYNESKCDIVALYANSFLQATRVHISAVPFHRNNQQYFLWKKKKKEGKRDKKCDTRRSRIQRQPHTYLLPGIFVSSSPQRYCLPPSTCLPITWYLWACVTLRTHTHRSPFPANFAAWIAEHRVNLSYSVSFHPSLPTARNSLQV